MGREEGIGTVSLLSLERIVLVLGMRIIHVCDHMNEVYTH